MADILIGGVGGRKWGHVGWHTVRNHMPSGAIFLSFFFFLFLFREGEKREINGSASGGN